MNAISIRRSIRVALVHAYVCLQEETQYRSNTWVHLANTATNFAVSMATLLLVFSHVESLGGWTREDLVVVLGCWFALGAVINGVVHPSVAQLAQQIRLGAFDYRLLKPVDSQIIALTQRVNGWQILDLLGGIGLIAGGMTLGGHASVQHVAVGLAMFLLGVAIVASVWLLIASVVFWTIQGEGVLWALDDIYENLRWPISIFPPGLRIALTAVFPAGFAVTVPAEGFTAHLTSQGAVLAVALTSAFAALSRVVWIRAIRRYEGASS